MLQMCGQLHFAESRLAWGAKVRLPKFHSSRIASEGQACGLRVQPHICRTCKGGPALETENGCTYSSQAVLFGSQQRLVVITKELGQNTYNVLIGHTVHGLI
jgi:hypothetical protein